MNPLPAQRLASPTGRFYPELEEHPYPRSRLRAIRSTAPGNFLVAKRRRGDTGWEWPPSPEHLPHLIEWLRRLTPLPHPLLVSVFHPEFAEEWWEDRWGKEYPIALSEHLLFLLQETPR